MVVAGRLPNMEAAHTPLPTIDLMQNDQMIQYEIIATQAKGEPYVVEGVYNGSAVCF